MKQINLWSGRSYLISENKLQEIIKDLTNGIKNSIVDVGDGQGFIISAVSDWGEVETEPYYRGMKMNKDLTRVWSGGEWKNFIGRKDEIEHKPILNNLKKLK
jgi:hypothetical protein